MQAPSTTDQSTAAAAVATRSYLICLDPAQRQHAAVRGAGRHRRRRPARGVLPAPPKDRPAAAAAGVLRGGADAGGRADPRPLHPRRRRAQPVRPAPLRQLPRVPRLDDRTGNHAQRRVRGEGDVGLLQRLRGQPPRHAGQRRDAHPGGARAHLPRPRPLDLRHPPRQAAPGDLAVEGDPELDMEARARAARWSPTTSSTASPRSTTSSASWRSRTGSG